jgi:hypothetical protein
MGFVVSTMDLQREHETPLGTHHLRVLDRTQRRINHLLPLRIAKVTEHWTLERGSHRCKGAFARAEVDHLIPLQTVGSHGGRPSSETQSGRTVRGGVRK